MEYKRIRLFLKLLPITCDHEKVWETLDLEFRGQLPRGMTEKIFNHSLNNFVILSFSLISQIKIANYLNFLYKNLNFLNML